MTEPREVVSSYGDKCRLCKGSGRGFNDEGECRVCHGSGKRTDERVKLNYLLENGAYEQEDINYKLTGPSHNPTTNTPISPSTLFVRLRAISGNNGASEEELDAWYSSLPEPIKLPVQVVIGPNDKATFSKILQVVKAGAPIQRVQPQRAPADYGDHRDEPWDEDNWEHLSR